MFKRVVLRFLPVLIILSVMGTPLLQADDVQSWLNNSFTFRIGPSLRLLVSNEIRFNEVTFSESYLRNWQGGILVTLPRGLFVGFLYKRESVDVFPINRIENRFTLEGGWAYRFAPNWSFDLRFKSEIRRYESALAENHLRLRLRARLVTSIRIGRLMLKPFLATEPFYDTIGDRIFRNRFYAGTAVVLTPAADLVINYIRQDTRGGEPVHILNSGINLRF
jgi:hypothetical protein